MPSITYWNRIEPRPRSESVKCSLAAQVRDPLWFLTRQWQFGEFQGEDAASPAYVQMSARFSPIDGWQIGDGEGTTQNKYDNKAPLEALVESEPFTPDWATAVELGQQFESMLTRALTEAQLGLPEAELARLIQGLIQGFRNDYPIPLMPEEKLADQEAARFLRVCAGRAIHGIELYETARASLPDLPDKPEIDTRYENTARQALEQFRDWVQAVYGDLSKGDAPAWRPERLEYGVQVLATTPDGDRTLFNAYPGREGEFDWYAFDQMASVDVEDASVRRAENAVEPFSRSVLPINVRFRGMPNARWWHFEHSSFDFGAIEPDRRELAKLVVMDFMLIHSNDWFVVPFVQDVGTLCRIDSLLVHDVFGGITVIDRADREQESSTQLWSMFSTTVEDKAGGLSDFFILPPSAITSTLSSETLEEVRFLRDEMANMVWAIEHITENGIGAPWPGHERALSTQVQEALNSSNGDPIAPLKYLIQTTVPEHWIPFLPVLIDPARRDIALERAAMLDPNDPIYPAGRILNPTRLKSEIHDLDVKKAYRIREEEITRTGAKVSRVVRRSRWIDGSTHLWIARRKRAGAGEGSSGLRFDIAVSTQSRGEG